MNIFALLVNAAHLLKSLEIMWKGLVAIFVVIALIIIVTKLVNKACVEMDIKREKKKQQQEEQNNSSNS